MKIKTKILFASSLKNNFGHVWPGLIFWSKKENNVRVLSLQLSWLVWGIMLSVDKMSNKDYVEIEKAKAEKEYEVVRKYYTVLDVANELGITTSMIRFWETELGPLHQKRTEGKIRRRKFTPEGLLKVQEIRDLLKNNRYTIEGVRQLLNLKKP